MVNPSAPDNGVPKWDGLPHTHPLCVHLHQMEKDLMGSASQHQGMHPANMAAIIIAEWMSAFTNEQLPSNVRNYCVDIAVLRTKSRRWHQQQEAEEQMAVAAEMAAAEYAGAHMPDDASSLTDE